MNSLNLKQIDGGNIIKQADSGSMFKFELLDENHKKFEEQLDDTATVILKQGTVAVFKKIVAVIDNCVAFNLDKILEVGDYILEIIVGEYVFPSNNRLKISVESTYGDYQPENLVRITYEEIDKKINALTDRLEELNVAGQTEMMNRIVALEKKEDKDTVYDDTKIKNSIDSLKSTVEQNEVNMNQELLGIGQKQAKMNDRLAVLESKEDKDTVYDDSDIKRRVTALESKPDKDTIYDDTELKERLSNLEKKESQYISKFSGLELKDSDLESRVSTLEQKEDKDTVYDDSAIVKRVEALEQKPDNDTTYDDTEIRQSIANVDNKMSGLSEKVTALEERPIVDTALTERVEALERKEDKDTVYDDTAIKKELSELNQSIAKKKLYFAYANDSGNGVGFTKLDAPDSIYTLLYQYFGISEKDSDNHEDYFWVPTQAMVVIELSSIKTEIDKLKKLHEVKRPPYGYRLNRKADPWELIFDNGCILTFPLDTIHNYYGWNESPIKINTRPNKVYPYSTPEMIMWYVKGHRTVEYLKSSDASSYTEYINCELKNPINDSSLYNFDNAFGDASDDTLIGKRNFVKLLYELDALLEDDLLSVGVTKK